MTFCSVFKDHSIPFRNASNISYFVFLSQAFFETFLFFCFSFAFSFESTNNIPFVSYQVKPFFDFFWFFCFSFSSTRVSSLKALIIYHLYFIRSSVFWIFLKIKHLLYNISYDSKLESLQTFIVISFNIKLNKLYL